MLQLFACCARWVGGKSKTGTINSAIVLLESAARVQRKKSKPRNVVEKPHDLRHDGREQISSARLLDVYFSATMHTAMVTIDHCLQLRNM